MENYSIIKQKGLILCIGLALFVFSYRTNAQSIFLNNPSFEGTVGSNMLPSPWLKCNFNTPDTQPGVFGVILLPYDGSSYIGLTDNSSHGFQEMAGQLLPIPLIANKSYSLKLYLAYFDFALLGGKAELEIWGGISSCNKDELLWKSDTIKNYSWKQYQAIFIPSVNLNYILLVCNNLSGNGPYLLIDSISAIKEIELEIIIPNLITPNKDGKNDYFEIPTIPATHRLEIYNRWGQRIYENTDYKNDWQGEEDGVYYYLLFTEYKVYKGWVQVIR